MNDSNAASVLREFGETIGIPQLGLNDDRLCTLSFDDVIANLELSDDGTILTCYLWIAEVGAERRAEIALALADANYLFAGTHGATLGMNRSSGDLVLCAQFQDATLTRKSFEQSLENLVNLAQSWQQRVVKVSIQAEEANSAPPISSADSFSFRA